MKRTFCVVAAALLLAGAPAPNAHAKPDPSFESMLLSAWDSFKASLSDFKGSWGGGIDEQYPPRTTLIKVGKCFSRAADAQADDLGLPKEFCVDIVGTEIHYPYHPFSRESVMLIEGKPVSGRLHISGGSRESFGWAVVGSLLSEQKADQQCGRLNFAGAAIYVGTDLEGKPLVEAPVSVRGFLYDGSVLCRTPAKSVEIPYTPSR